MEVQSFGAQERKCLEKFGDHWYGPRQRMRVQSLVRHANGALRSLRRLTTGRSVRQTTCTQPAPTRNIHGDDGGHVARWKLS